jgi:hypothetical protein
MLAEYIRDEKIAPYVIICAKDGTRFIVIGNDCKVSYDDTIYDRIAESDEATALAKLGVKSETTTKDGESKTDAIALLTSITSKISP